MPTSPQRPSTQELHFTHREGLKAQVEGLAQKELSEPLKVKYLIDDSQQTPLPYINTQTTKNFSPQIHYKCIIKVSSGPLVAPRGSSSGLLCMHISADMHTEVRLQLQKR